LPGVRRIELKATKVIQNRRQIVKLTWTGARGKMVDQYRNKKFQRATVNDGIAFAYPQRRGTFLYQICEAGTSRCSKIVSVPIN
jgi:hypothetical protein